MALFFKRKDEIEWMKKMSETMEGSQRSTELMIQFLDRVMTNDKPGDDGIGKFESEDEEKFEKIRAAYALNLCTVSVSQIVDYGDIHILEQEYETILNNLNLEHMPKDEALLSILRQLLDTITFFRIQEGEKKFIEKEYQQKMKNAIWSAVPNWGIIVASGNPITMAVSLASQIGIGYMNYRKSKAENKLEKERQEWQLQRTAIEQFNGLRRELFDTSWRLADRYHFPDEYRLTEKQISQYNQILMDANVLRKYDRLDAIKNCFTAYPPFWYHYGHAANEIAQKAFLNEETDIYLVYRKLALAHFRYYMKVNKYALLREDYIASACALECVDLLDESDDREEMKRLIEAAQESSGRECDILQLCAIAYLRLGETGRAVSLLKYLVNERYNDILNAQLLSNILVKGIIEDRNNNYKIEYELLSKKKSKTILFPLPENGENMTELQCVFVKNQQEDLLWKYAYVLRNYCDICYVKFNKALPVPFDGEKYDDDFFSINKMPERVNEYKKVFQGGSKQQDFLVRISESNFVLEYLDVFNEMVNGITQIIPYDGNEKISLINRLVNIIEGKIKQKREDLDRAQAALGGDNPVKAIEQILDISFDVFTEEFFKVLIKSITSHVDHLERLDAFSKEESVLRTFCLEHHIPEFKMRRTDGDLYDEFAESKVFFTSDLFGGEAFEKAEKVKRAQIMAKIIEDKIPLLMDKDVKNTNIYTRWNPLTKEDFNSYFTKGRRKYFIKNKEVRMATIAVIKDTSFSKTDLIFTINGLFLDKAFTHFSDHPEVTAYNQVEYREGKIHLGKEQYSNKEIEMRALYDLIQQLLEKTLEYSSNNNQGNREERLQLEELETF